MVTLNFSLYNPSPMLIFLVLSIQTNVIKQKKNSCGTLANGQSFLSLLENKQDDMPKKAVCLLTVVS